MTAKKKSAPGKTGSEPVDNAGPEVEINLGMGGLFQGLGNLMTGLADLARQGSVEKEFNVKGVKDTKGVFGFTVKTCDGGPVEVEPFGNVHKDRQSGETTVTERREPVVDVFDEARHVLVVAELPGVGEGDVKLQLTGDVLQLTAENDERLYEKELLLPSPCQKRGMKTEFRNGILQVTLPKVKTKT
ncbi:MAG: Hsp20/alpha crystallin family protein [Verrucomicrobia bacterium]|nr:Hsp20/alpha crystallin family protein [Verrucomicrobiota bacterium]